MEEKHPLHEYMRPEREAFYARMRELTAYELLGEVRELGLEEKWAEMCFSDPEKVIEGLYLCHKLK